MTYTVSSGTLKLYYTISFCIKSPAYFAIFQGTGTYAFSHVTAEFVNMPFDKEDTVNWLEIRI